MAIAGLEMLGRNVGKLKPGQSIGGSQEEFAFPDLAGTLAGVGTGTAGAASAELLKLLSDPASHPAYQASLKGVLASMQPQKEQALGDLEDQFRQAGALQSGAYGTSVAKTLGEFNRNETIAASDVLSKLLPTLVQGYSGPANNVPNLLGALKQRTSFDIGQTGGGSGGGGGAPVYSAPTYRPIGSSHAPQVTVQQGATADVPGTRNRW